jgi:hypothetical protein
VECGILPMLLTQMPLVTICIAVRVLSASVLSTDAD